MRIRILTGDCRETLRGLDAGSVDCCITSPPYFGLRSYLPDGHPDKGREIGLEPTPAEFMAALVETFREVRRVLRDDGTLWVNLGDSYAGGRLGGNPVGSPHQPLDPPPPLIGAGLVRVAGQPFFGFFARFPPDLRGKSRFSSVTPAPYLMAASYLTPTLDCLFFAW